MKPQIEEVQDHHILALARFMREEDLKEIGAWGIHESPEEALRRSIAISDEAHVLTHNGKTLCIFGVATAIEAGIPWMLTSVFFGTSHMRAMHGFTSKLIRQWLDTYGRLFNHVHVDNKRPQRWLRWMGFTVPPRPSLETKSGEQFIHFSMTKESYV